MGLQLTKAVPLLLRPKILDARSAEPVRGVAVGVDPVDPQPGAYAHNNGMRELGQHGGIVRLGRAPHQRAYSNLIVAKKATTSRLCTVVAKTASAIGTAAHSAGNYAASAAPSQ